MITLTYQSFVLQLRDPDFENKESVTVARICRKNKGGELVVFRDPEWPITNILDYNCSFLTQLQVNQLLAFIAASLGQYVTLVDFEARTWIGIIITPAGEVSQPMREGFSAKFQFQGVLQ